MKGTYKIPFAKIANEIIQSEELTIYQKMMYIVLCSHANQSNTCFPSYETLAREVGCCRNKAITIISELEEMGLIKIERAKTPKGNHKSNSYEIVVDNCSDSIPDAPGSQCNALGGSAAHVLGSAPDAPELYKSNNINSSNNNQSTIDSILENAELERLHNDDDELLYKTVIEKMYHSKTITVDGNVIPQKTVREQLEKIDYGVIVEGDNCIKHKPIANKIGYLISVIYNELLLKVH
jgi:hypothetical protein